MTSLPAAGDLKLIQEAAGGSGDAFDSLFGPLVEPAYRLALMMLEDASAAEDAVQEGTLRAWRRLPQLKDIETIKPWFMAIVANECRSQRRHRWWSTLRLADPPERAAHGIEEGIIQRLDLDRAFGRLNVEERLPIHLYFYEDMRLEQVAVIMGTSVPAARSRLYRALKRLRPGLELREVAL